MKRYFIADLHLGCKPHFIRGMLRRYPRSNVLFPSVEEHDAHLLGAINCTVGVNDELYILGDFSDKPGKYRAQIKCKHVFLIRGNHDPVEKSRNVFGEIPFQRVIKLRDSRGVGRSMYCVLSHAPQAFWFGSHKGWAHLYGHVHGQREDYLDLALGVERRSMDVGVDSLRQKYGDYFPLDEEALCAIFTMRQGHDLPSYYHDFQKARDFKYGFSE
jgi:calcineurin-like phosphoesterase family protein